MKKRNMSKRFSLNKRTVADLNSSEQRRVLGGNDRCALECKSGSAYYYASGEYIIGTVHYPDPLPPTTIYMLACVVSPTDNDDK